MNEIEQFFIAPKANKVEVEFKEPQKDRIIDLLCGRHEFSIERVEKAIEKIEKKPDKEGQSKLEGWF